MSQDTKPVLPNGRFSDIDFIRGFMLLSMAVDHGTSLTRAMGRHAASPVTISQILPSTTIEIFFFLSGYLYGHTKIANKKNEYIGFVRDAYLRAFQLYAFNVLTFMLVLLMFPLFSFELLAASRFDSVSNDSISAIRHFMFLESAPFGLDVLQIYIIYFVFAPVFSVILLRNKFLAIAWLLGSWLAMQIWSAAVGLQHDETIAINMIAWQITFFGGIALGAHRAWGKITAYITKTRALTRTCGMLLLVMAIAWIGQKYPHRYGFTEAPWSLPMVDRATLAPLKLLSSICVLVVMISMTYHYRLTETLFGRFILILGQRSLACFCASNIGIYIVAITWEESGSNLVFWLAELGMVIGVMIWIAFVDWISPSKKAPRSETDHAVKVLPPVGKENNMIFNLTRDVPVPNHP